MSDVLGTRSDMGGICWFLSFSHPSSFCVSSCSFPDLFLFVILWLFHVLWEI